MHSITYKGKPNPKKKSEVKIEMIFFKTGLLMPKKLVSATNRFGCTGHHQLTNRGAMKKGAGNPCNYHSRMPYIGKSQFILSCVLGQGCKYRGYTNQNQDVSNDIN